MGKLTYGMNISVDGYIADRNGDIGWSDPDAELHQYWNDQVRNTAVSLYGRKLYELMAAHWPTADEAPDVSPVEAEYARLWRDMPKVVFSTTLGSVGWNSRLERGDVVDFATKLKADTDGVIDVAGATLAAPLVRAASSMSSMARTFGAPVRVPAGKHAATASSACLPSARSPETVDTRCMTWL